MKLSNLSIKYTVMLLLVCIITPIYFLFAVINYNSIRSGILDNTLLAIKQTRINIIDTIINTEKSYELISSYYDDIMIDALLQFLAAYESNGNDITTLDLESLKQDFQNELDFYIIDENGVIIATTFPSALGLDFKTDPNFYQILTTLRLGHDLEISHVTSDIKTGELRKWGYIPTTDHRYVLEVGISSAALSQYVTQLNHSDMEKVIRDNNPFISDIIVYDKHHVILGKGETETDATKIAAIDGVVDSGVDQLIIDDSGLLSQEYLLVNTFPGGLNDTQKIVAITYNYDTIINQIDRTRTTTMLIFLAYAVLSLLLIYFLVSQTLTKPLIRLTNRIKTVSVDNLNFKMPVTGNNEIGQLAQSFNELSQNLKSTLVTKKYLENVIDSVGDVLIIMDQDLNIKRINQYTRLFWGKPCDEIIGQPIASLFDSSFSQSEIMARLKDNPHLENLEGTMIKEGCYKTSVIASITAFQGAGESIHGYILNAKDISKTKKLLKKLEESNLNLKKQESILLEQSNTDALTGACNRGCIFRVLEEIHANIPLLYHTFTVMMIDLDHFKAINDRYGHQAGDDVLVESVRIIMENLRKTDFLGRYGGEEFLIVMPDTTLEEGYQIAERIRVKIRDARFYNNTIDLTISGGIAQWHHTSIDELIETADQLLYQAKKSGRNTILRSQ